MKPIISQIPYFYNDISGPLDSHAGRGDGGNNGWEMA